MRIVRQNLVWAGAYNFVAIPLALAGWLPPWAAGLGMASPYLVIGAFPQLLRFLPKPGAWMDTFKQIMGFVQAAGRESSQRIRV